MKRTPDEGSSGEQRVFELKQEIVDLTGGRETAAGSVIFTLSGGDETPMVRILTLMFSCCIGLLSETAWYQEDSSNSSRRRRQPSRRDLPARSRGQMVQTISLQRCGYRQNQHKQRSEKLAVDQLILALSERPTKFRARWQEKFFDGPTARKDAEEALRAKWLQELESLLKGTKTPMAKILDTKAGYSNLLGGGRKTPTLRPRARAAKKYFSWFADSADVAFQTQVAHLTGFLESRHSEPCNRGALKAAHQCLVFLKDVAGVEEKLTNALYTVVCRELLSSLLSPTGSPSRRQGSQLQFSSPLRRSSWKKERPST